MNFEEAMKVIFREISYMGNENECIEKMYNFIEREHRTLQQNFWRMIYYVMKRYGENSEWTDLRNQASRKWCKKVTKEEYFPFV